jgi:hypothetical protein
VTTEVAAAGPGHLEAELLLLCARLELEGEEARTRVQALLQGPLDWDQVLDWAGYHHVTTLLHHHLQSVGKGLVPADVLQELRVRYHGIAARGLKLDMELLSLLRELEEADAPGVIWKGPALAHTLYPSPELRTYADLDIILRREDRARARAVFRRRGYAPPPGSLVTEDQLFEAEGEDATLWNPATAIPLDLHWGSIRRYRSSVTDFQDLWSEHDTLELHGQTLRILRSDTLLLALSVHGAKHGPFPWPALKWITDMEAYLRGHPPAWWPPVVERARKEGCLRMLLLGLALAEEILEAPLPPAVRASLARNPEVRKLVPDVRRRMLDPTHAHFPLGKRIAFDLAVRERWRDRVAYRAVRILTPSSRDSDPRGAGSHRWLRIPLRILRLARTYLLRPATVRNLFQGGGPPDRGGSE